MKSLWKKLLTLAVAAVCLWCIVMNANAADEIASGTCGANLTWVMTGDGVLTISGEGNMYDYNMSSTPPWNSYRESITSAVVEDGITALGNYSFLWCTNLASVKLPDSLTTIGTRAFHGCSSLVDITIPESVTYLGSDAFFSCESLVFVKVPSGVTEIYFGLFRGCSSLVEVDLHDGITEIGNEVFYGCSSLASIAIPSGVTMIGSSLFEGCTALTDITIPDSVTDIGSYAFSSCESLAKIQIPSGVTEIGSGAFNGCAALVRVQLPEGIRSIENYLFKNCAALQEVDIPEGTVSIGKDAFKNCTALTTIRLPDSLTSIDDGAFSGCTALKTIAFPAGLQSFGDQVISGCTGIEEIVLPGCVTSVGSSAFANCTNLKTVVIPECVTAIESKAFYNCVSLENVNLPSTLTEIGDKAFAGSAVTSIVVPAGVTQIGEYTFSGCPELKSVELPEGLISIGNSAFEKCSALEQINLPSTLTQIGMYAFEGCESITQMDIPDGVTAMGSGVFYNCTGLRFVSFPASIGTLPQYTCHGCTNLTEVSISDGISAIDSGAFDSCVSLTEITIPDSVTSIGFIVFRACTGLTAVDLPDGLTELGDSVFEYCTGLTAIEIPEGVTTICSSSFGGCTALTYVKLPASVTEIEGFAFYECTSLSDIQLPEGLTAIGERAFFCCEALTSVQIPDGVTVIPDRAFRHCTALAKVTLGSGVTQIGPDAFSQIGLTVITFEGSAPSFDSTAFSQSTIVAVYPTNDGTWTEAVMLDYGGSVTWSSEELAALETGSCGDGLTWTVSSDGTLTISGTGDMDDYGSYYFTPWVKYREMITKVVVEEGVTSISKDAFGNLPVLQTVSIAGTVKTIGSSAFTRCVSLKEVNIPEGVTSIGDYLFSDCTSLTKVTIADSVTEMGFSCFFGCTALTDVTLSANVTELPMYTFEDCTALVSITVPEGVTKIRMNAFVGCTALQTVVLPVTMTELEKEVFLDCFSLNDLVIPENVMYFGADVFSGTASLERLFFLGSEPSYAGDTLFADGNEDVTAYHLADAHGWENATWAGARVDIWSCTLSGTATCTTPGTQIFTDDVHGIVYSRYISDPFHRLTGWTLVKAVTAEEEGQWVRSCTSCGYELSIAIPKLVSTKQTPLQSSNSGDQGYNSYYANLVCSYLVDTGDGFMRVEAAGSYVNIEYYDESFNFISRLGVQKELSLFGGYYTDGTYHYLVFGQLNKGENDEVEVLRVVRYSLDWNRMDSVGIYGANTTIPFDAGSLRMAHSGDMLYIRTSHEMYTHSDGLNHQSNMTVVVYTPTMTVTEMSCSPTGTGYVSHSFNQFIIADGNDIIAADHGDGYPRAMVIIDYRNSAGDYFLMDGYAYDVLPIYGTIGANATGASMGGLEASQTHYLTAGSSIVQDGSMKTSGQRNIYITATSREDHTTEIHWLTSYAKGSGVSVSVPHLVKIDSDRFAVLWTEGGKLKYVFVDGTGEWDGVTYSASAKLSDCKPIVVDGKIIWYVTASSVPKFYVIDTGAPETVSAKEVHAYTCTVTAEPTEDAAGSATVKCSICGDSAVLTLPVLNTQDYIVTLEGASCTALGTAVYTWKNSQYGLIQITVVTSAGAHDYTVAITRVPTAENSGEIRCTCALCGETVLVTLPAMNETDYTTVITAEPTCTDAGTAVYTWTETAYGVFAFEVTVPALEHRMETVQENLVPPTCTESGSCDEVVRCTRCGRELSREQTVLPATGHTPGVPEWENYMEPADGVVGSFDEVVCCTVCGQELSRIHCTFSYVLGDVNCDGWIDAEDAALIMQYEVGLIGDDAIELGAADVNGDGWIDAEDAALIMQYEVGLIDSF